MDIKNFLLGFALSFSAFMLSDYVLLLASNHKEKSNNDGLSTYFNNVGGYFGEAINQYEQKEQA
ncbi:hypothetical protein IJG72_06340 [bacterium]|nr:hypothetical protein [bacterium]